MSDTEIKTLHPAELALIQMKRKLVEAEFHQKVLENERMKRTDRTFAADAHEHHRYTLWGVVNAVTCATAISHLDQWSREAPGCDITLVINSPGGNVIDGLALYDYLQQLRHDGHKLTTVTVGMAASMGGVLLQAGDVRVASRNSVILIHEVATGASGKMTDLEDEIEFTKRLQSKLVEILAERSTMTKRQIETRWKRRDWWLDAEDALSKGFVDEIR